VVPLLRFLAIAENLKVDDSAMLTVRHQSFMCPFRPEKYAYEDSQKVSPAKMLDRLAIIFLN
jgi:hypothetical protein